MKPSAVGILAATVLAAACGGSSFSTSDSDSGTGASSGSSGGSSSGASSSSGGASGSSSGGKGGPDGGSGSGGPKDGGGDAPADGPTVMCNGDLRLCETSCVDVSTSAQNCGGCGSVCNTQCTNGVCPLVSTQQGGAPPSIGDGACITIDSTSVYWTTALYPGYVLKVPIDGGTITTLASNQEIPRGLSVANQAVYFANEGTGAGCSGNVATVPTAGGTISTLAGTQCSPFDVAADTTQVIWTNGTDGSVWETPTGTDGPMALVSGMIMAKAGYLRMSSSNVYFTDLSSDTLERVVRSGAPVAMPVSVPVAGPDHVAIDKNNVYLGSNDMGTSTILSFPVDTTGSNGTQIVKGLKSVSGIVSNGESLWYAVPSATYPASVGDGEIHRYDMTKQSDVTLATGQDNPQCIAVDQTSVYWIEASTGMVVKTGI